MKVYPQFSIALMLCCLTVHAHAPKPDAPSLVRKWTQPVGGNASVVAVKEGVVYYRGYDGVGALDIVTGQRKWNSLSDQWVPAAALQGHVLYVLAETEKTTALETVDIATGRSWTLARLPDSAKYLVADAARVYVLDETGKLRAYRENSGHLLWSRQLGPIRKGGVLLAQLAVTEDGIYADLNDAGEFAVDPQGGTILWQHAAQYAADHRPIVIGGDVIVRHEKLTRTTVRTHQVVWQVPAEEDADLVDGILVTGNKQELLGRDVANGHVLWRLPVNYAFSPPQEPGAVSEGARIWINRTPLICVTREGQEVWHQSRPFTGTPIYAAPRVVVTMEDTRLLGYTLGTSHPLPTSDAEKRALAERLAAQFEFLDNAERKLLESLVPYAFQPLLARYIEWAKASEIFLDIKRGYRYYSLLQDTKPLLLATCRREDTDALVAALPKLSKGSPWRPDLERILQAKGESAAYIPFLVRDLRRLPLKDRQESEALSVVAHSSHPEAVALMLEALRDPKAAPAWRREAFRHLAGTGGKEGIEAVRAARAQHGPNAEPRELGDTEKILAACIEARFFEAEEAEEAILYVPGVKPFKIYGYPSTLQWYDSRGVNGGGAISIAFSLPHGDMEREGRFIRYSPDGKMARTLIFATSGPRSGNGFEMTLIKVADDWFVVECQHRIAI
ncbi:MAG TPA: PQQ-binding-like beta-propeller repeat protein [Chthonomonadaceae bacterium]|nr:PQQ-binding-like beta-propeller repeat protein [Chthonomonadaceae bacterium]